MGPPSNWGLLSVEEDPLGRGGPLWLVGGPISGAPVDCKGAPDMGAPPLGFAALEGGETMCSVPKKETVRGVGLAESVKRRKGGKVSPFLSPFNKPKQLVYFNKIK